MQTEIFHLPAVLLGTALSVLACAADATNATANAVSEGPALAVLRAENDALRRENQMLRRELVARRGAAPDALLPVKLVDRGESFTPPEEDTGYWISSKSKIRHNRRCRNYRKVKGRPCGPNDGRPCKTCGG